MDKILVSVIIPIYNAEKYLDECIESVVNQTYTNLEIILLPGNSADRSAEICESWAEKDSRILITPQDKNCTGYARNKGIASAHGEYVAFCDADDKMMPNYVEEMVSSTTSNDSDIVECGYYNASEDLTQLKPYDILELLSDFPHSFYERFGSSSVWRYIVRKKFWTDNGFSFPEANRMEDLAVYSLMFAMTSKISFVHKPLYAYRENPRSVMHTASEISTVINNYMFIADYMVKEHRRLGIFERTKRTILSQLEYHADYILTDFTNLSCDERTEWERSISDKLKTLFGCKITAFDMKAFGWGGKGTGLLCSLMTKQCKAEGRYISQMTLRGMTNENIKTQLEALLSDLMPNTVVIDLLEETDYILKYKGDIDEYLKQWALGVLSFYESVKRCTTNPRIFIIEKYLATKHLSEGQMYDYQEKEDIAILNELLHVMYQSLIKQLPDSTFIPSIPDNSRYSLSADPKDGHNFDEAYYLEEIMDIIHYS